MKKPQSPFTVTLAQVIGSLELIKNARELIIRLRSLPNPPQLIRTAAESPNRLPGLHRPGAQRQPAPAA